MNLSSNCITHFTSKLANIEKMLSGHIYGSYCKETLNYQGNINQLYVPMISFCDVPIKTYSNIGAPYGK